MTRTMMEEAGPSTLGAICEFDARSGSAPRRGLGELAVSGLHLAPVRDYKDRFILRMLQGEARKENPGFLLLQPAEKAKVAWADAQEGRIPVGYYVYWEPRRAFSKHSHGFVQLPATFSQVFVIPGMRRRGIATRMLRDFISRAPSGAVWVESPKLETVALLHKLGYNEPDQRYELWQMMEGLSRWVRAEEIAPRSSDLSPECAEAWVWAGDGGVGISELR
jgi:GNAT superfamily N-acetyltransferase